MAKGQSMTTDVLITRPIAQAYKTTLKLQDLGIVSYVDPMLIVEQLPININTRQDYQAILITSANAVPALQHIQKRHIVFTVGDATADAVRASYPFHQVINAQGTSYDLVLLVEQRLKPQIGPLLYISGDKIHFDLTEHFKSLGFTIDRVIAYDTHPAHNFLATTYELLENNQLHSILFYSQRTAQTFANIIIQNNIQHCLKGIHAQTLSGNIAEPLSRLPFKKIKVANKPTEAALIMQLRNELFGTKKN
jgi:uroporphyrinogen-III synthase